MKSKTILDRWNGLVKRAIVLLVAGGILSSGLTAFAQDLVAVSEDFAIDPPGFNIELEETGDAMASLEFSDLGDTREMIFQGNWLTDPESSEFELAFGALVPVLINASDFHFEPAISGGIESVSSSADVILNGRPGDTNFANEAVGYVLRLWQNQAGEINVYEVGRRLDSRTRVRFRVLDLRPEDFRQISGSGSSMPDFSDTAEPIAFGLAIGNGWALPDQPATAIQTSARIDNWQVKVRVSGTLLADSFE